MMKYKNIISPVALGMVSLFTLISLQSVFAGDIIENLELPETFTFISEPSLFSSEEQSIALSIELENQIDSENTSTDFNIKDRFFDLSIQQKSLSCESSATSDILETLLLETVTEDDVIAKLPKDATYNSNPTWENGERIWGNPEIGFVGNIDNASQNDYTGYGVYEKPIASVYNEYGFETEILNIKNHDQVLTPKYHLTYLLKNLEKGNMVQLWGDWCTNPDYDDGVLVNMTNVDTKNLDGFISAKNTCEYDAIDRILSWSYYDENGNLTKHTGLSGEHAFILLGWKGEITNPSHIRVWDTDTGYHEYQTIEWMRKWEAMDYRSIVVNK